MTTVAIVLIVSVFAFAVLGVPLAWSLGLSSLCAILTTGTISLGMLAQRMYTGGAVYAFLAIFFFIFAGNIMTYGGLSKRLIRFANGLVGHHTGGTSIGLRIAKYESVPSINFHCLFPRQFAEAIHVFQFHNFSPLFSFISMRSPSCTGFRMIYDKAHANVYQESYRYISCGNKSAQLCI